MKKVFISTTSFAQFSNNPLENLKSNGYMVELNEFGRKLDKSDCLKIYNQYDGIIADEILIQNGIIITEKSKVEIYSAYFTLYSKRYRM